MSYYNLNDIINQIIEGDALTQLKQIPSESIDCIITSPPYDDIYNYNNNNNDPNYDFENIATELYRVLKNGKVMIWIEGIKTKNFDESDTVYDHIKFFRKIGFLRPDTMIYQKKGFGKPEPEVRKRYVQSFEFMLVLSKGIIESWNPIKDRPNSCAGMKHQGRTVRQKDGTLKKNKLETLRYNNFGLRYNIWQYQNSYGHGSSDKIAYEHPAIFPERLAADHIKSWSNENDIILDPFMGSGTTAKMALKYNRRFIGIEKNKDYIHKIAQKRIEPYLKQQKLNDYLSL